MDRGLYMRQLLKPRYITLLVIGIILIAIITGIVWLTTHSAITVTVTNPGKQELTYQITSSNDGSITTVKSNQNKLKKYVKNGSYEVAVQQAETSFYKLISVRSVFKSTNIEAKLEAEKTRTFVGDGPGPCMYYGSDLLYSSSCSTTYDNLNAHIPATTQSPSFTNHSSEDTYGLSITGIIKDNGKNNIILASESEEGHPGAIDAYELGGAPNLVGTKKSLKNIDESVSIAQQENNKFVLYSKSLNTVLQYDSLASEPQSITIDKPANEDLNPVSLSLGNNRIAAVYSTNTEGIDAGLDNFGEDAASEHNDEKGTVAVQVYESGKTYSLKLDGTYKEVRLCGDYLCALGIKNLSVYEIKNKKTKKLFELPNVLAVENDQNNLIVIKENEVISLNIAQRTGSFNYSLGTYTFCGSSSVIDGGYLICVVDEANNTHALYVNTKQTNTDSVDKKVAALVSNKKYISSVSPYKNFIYISPSVGDISYQSSTNNYGYDIEVRRSVAASINDLILKNGLDTAKYTIVNTLP